VRNQHLAGHRQAWCATAKLSGPVAW
jgi:hypothetical protein